MTVCAALGGAGATAANARVLLVGTFHGVAGQYSSPQAAVAAAQPGDWVLLAPGDYKTDPSQIPPTPYGGVYSSILITTPNLHLRGMNRNQTWIDGTRPGSGLCSNAAADQNFGVTAYSGKPAGYNGVVVYRSSGDTLENFSACNFLSGDSGGGNEIWFDGGAGSGTQFPMSFRGAYLSATSSFYKNSSSPAAAYGIYSSNTSRGPGLLAHDFASNMDDSGFYVGACPDCRVTLEHVHSQDNVLGYSGTNSGGHLRITTSEFDHNQDGFDTNSQNNDDAPSPQNGACPGSQLGPRLPGTRQQHSCWVFDHNYVHDNNNPNAPAVGIASAGPVGTGMSISGGRGDIVVDNRFVNNGAWGLLLIPFLDEGPPPSVAHCQGGAPFTAFSPTGCYYDDWGNEIAHNTFSHNGFFGNPSNGDAGEAASQHTPGNCWHDNVDPSGRFTSDPAKIQITHGRCGIPNSANVLGSTLLNQVLCDTQLLQPCPPGPGMRYPRQTAVRMPAMPKQPTMPNPCLGVPANPWCRAGKPI